MIDSVISHYKILQKLGEGGMGMLYLAEDININRKAVLKFLPPDSADDPDINSRFKREAQAAGSLSHPNIVTIYDVGTHENRTFIAMEYVEGKTIRNLITCDELTVEEIVNILVQICEGLNEAHNKGIIHRDIKPENIIIDEKDRVKILDFGLARIEGKTQLTKDGSTLGTVRYMSPEQIRNEKVNQRTDIWSVGVMLYEMITRKYPFKGEYEASLFYSIINDQPEPIARYKSGISEAFQRIIDKALDKDPETRYQHIDDLLADLRKEKKESSKSIIISQNSFEKGKKSHKKNYIISASILILLVLGLSTYYLLNIKSKIFKPPKYRQITYEGNIYLSGLPNMLAEITQISPDGRYTAYVVDDKKNRSIYIQENSSGKSFKIFSAWTIVCLRWSPDGNEIFFGAGFFDEAHSDFKNSKIYSPYLVSTSDWKPHPFNDGWCNGCWSPDGKYLALIFYVQDSIRIINKNTQHFERSIKFSQNYTKLYDIDWSLNGFACLTFNDKNKKFALWTFKDDGTQQKKIAESEQGIYSPRWSADGHYIYYFQGKENTVDLVKIKISSGGTSLGEPKIILSGLEAFGFSLSHDNRKFVYTKDTYYSNIWKLTFEKNKKTFKTKKLTNGTTYNYWLNISPDGEKIAFVNQGDIFIKSIDEGETKQLTSFNFECWSPSWSPDGKEIAFLSGSRDIIIVDTHEGIAQKTFRNIDFGKQLIWSSDSILLYNKLKDQNFYIFNIISGDRKTLIKNDTEKNSGEMSYPIYSPDRKKIIVYWYKWTGNSGLWLISGDDSSEKLLLWGQISPLKWSEDNEMFYACDLTKNPKEIIKVSSKSGIVEERIKMPSEDIYDVDITPDGKMIVYTDYHEISDVWMIENFDPDVE